MRQTLLRYLIALMLVCGIAGFLLFAVKAKTPAGVGAVMGSMDDPQDAQKEKPYRPGAVQRDVVYCHEQLLDIYHPRSNDTELSPTVVYMHGGGWVLNDKSSEPDQLAMIDGLRDKGFTVVSINYRKVPSGYYPQAIEDSLCAIRFLRAESKRFGLDPANIMVYGFSAGGYLAAMAGMLPDDSVYETDEYASFSSRVNAVITLAGIFDFTEGLNVGNQERIARFLNGADPLQAEVTAHVSPDDPSFMLLHGAEDQYVSVAQDNLLIARLQENEIDYEQIFISNADHGLNPIGGDMNPDKMAVQERIADFIISRLQPQ